MWFISRRKKRRRWHTTESQMKVRERAKGRCSLCQSWQIGQLPVCCDEEGRRGRRGRLKDPWQAGKRRGSLLNVVGRSALVAGRSQRTLFWRWMLSYLRKEKGTGKIEVSMKINRTNKLNCEKTDQALARILKHILLTHSEISDKSTTIWQKIDKRMWVLTWRWRRWSRRCTSFWGQCWGHIRAGRLGVFLEQVLIVDAKLVRAIWLKHKVHTKPNTSNKYSI